MDTDSETLKLCLEGTRAEFEGRIEAARGLYRQAWQAARDDYEACVAAHYVARHQKPEDSLRWNLVALARAEAVTDDRVRDYYASLYVNLGSSYEILGNQPEAQRYYKLAAGRGLIHQPDE